MATASKLPALLTVQEAADYLRVSKWAIWYRIDKGELPITRLGRRVYILQDELRTMLADQTHIPERDITRRGRAKKEAPHVAASARPAAD